MLFFQYTVKSVLTLVRPCMVNLPAQNHMDNLILKYII
jgi:hypothetical protein